MEMPKPQEQHRNLAAFAGTWTGEETLHPSPWDPKGGPATGKAESRVALGGFYVLTDYAQSRGGQAGYEGHGIYSWDPGEKCYTMHWFDGMAAMPFTPPARGTWEGNVLTFRSQSPMGHSRYVYEFRGEGRYDFRIENSQDGKQWQTFMDAKYTRK